MVNKKGVYFQLINKHDDTIISQYSENYNVEIYLDGSFSISTKRIIEGKLRWVDIDSKDYEIEIIFKQ